MNAGNMTMVYSAVAVLSVLLLVGYLLIEKKKERNFVFLTSCVAIVNTGCEVKAGCIINCGAIVDHGCILEEGVHVCLGAIVKAENRIPRCMKIEAGEIVANRIYPV